MRNKKLMELSDAELLQNEKKSKMAASVFAGIWLVLIAANIYLVFKKGFSASAAVPIAVLPLLIIVFNQWNGQKKEIKFRGL
jgi:hypothetical protein